MVVVYALLSVLAVSALSFIGAASLALSKKGLRMIVSFLVSFAAGAMLGDAFLHLLPEALGNAALGASLAALGGVVFAFVVEKFIHWHHCHNTNHEEHHLHPVGYLNLFGDAVHNFIDGIIIGASYVVSVPVGVATTVAVLLHEVPQELGDFGVLIHAGFSVRKALFFNFLTAVTAVAGAVLALAFSDVLAVESLLIGFAAGSFIYVALADLVPELHKETKVRSSLIQFGTFLLGIGLMSVLLVLE